MLVREKKKIHASFDEDREQEKPRGGQRDWLLTLFLSPEEKELLYRVSVKVARVCPGRQKE